MFSKTDDPFLTVVDGPVRYLHWSIRMFIAFLVAILINTEGQHKPFSMLVTQANYWLAVSFSFAIGVLLIWLIHWLTKRLDVRLPWFTHLFRRILFQFLLGVCLVLVFNYLLIRVYFWVFEMDFARTGYMQVEFPIIRWMVLLMNVFYISWFFAVSLRRSAKQNAELNSELHGFYEMKEQAKGYLLFLDADLGNKVVKISPEEVACFERGENVGWVWLLDGTRYNINYKMQDLAEILDPRLFFQISRSVMISMKAVRGYDRVKNQQGELNLKHGLKVEASLLVSRHRFEEFKRLFDNFEE